MPESQHATWGGRFQEGPSALMLRFSESISFDARLAPYDIAVNRAHSAMLAEVGILSREEKDQIHAGLDQLEKDLAEGRITWDPSFEDIHMNIEQALTRTVPAAAKMHSGRSRNDQVATDVRLFIKDASVQLQQALQQVMATLVRQARRYENLLIPGYTHLQRAQPVSVAYHFLAYVEMFARDRKRLGIVHDAANWCPLGSGAIAGSTLPLNRERTATLLGFVDPAGQPRLTANSMDAISDRDVFFDFASACAVCGVHFSRLAEDLILWSSKEFNLVDLPDAFCTGSSLMPQKKNPDAMEILRGKAARLQGNLHTLLTLVKGLPLTYNRDLQEDKPPLFDSFDQTLISLQVVQGCLEGLNMKEDSCQRAVGDPLLLATDLADYLVERGIPFRRAHHLVGTLVALAEKENCPIDQLPDHLAQGLDPVFSTPWREVFSLPRARERRQSPGTPGIVGTKDSLDYWEKAVYDEMDS